MSQGGSSSLLSALSADGRYVTFSSFDEPSGSGAGPSHGLFVWDRATGATSLVSEDADPVAGGSISGDGRRIALQTEEGVFLWQRATGQVTGLAEQVAVVNRPAISADGFDAAYADPDGEITVWSDRP